MNRFFLLISVLLAATISSAQIRIPMSYCSRGKTVAKKSKAAYKIVDMTYARLFFTVDPSVREINGNVAIYFKTTQAEQQSVSLDLHSDLRVQDVWAGDKKLASGEYEHKNDILTINFGRTLLRDVTDSVRVRYSGVPPTGSSAAFFQDSHSTDDIIWTLSEPYGGREWWPAQHGLVDKVDSLDLIVKAPAGYRTAANGLLVNEIDTENTHTDHWKHKYPIATYLVAFATSNYVTYSDYVPMGDKRLEVLNYVYPQSLENVKEDTKAIVGIMELFNELFIPYPFAKEKYGHAQFGWGGGMEHQTMSFMGVFWFGLQAHELAHQWFGNHITCGSWQDIWLNEGFATYLEGLCYEHELGTNTFGSWLYAKVQSVTSYPGGAVFVEDTTSVNRVFSSRLSYNKGAMVLHQLRKQIGDEAFFAGVKAYLNDEKLKQHFAKTADLKQHFETASQTDLTKYFDDWVYGEGYPVLQLRWAQNADNVFFVKINQTPSNKDGRVFNLKIPVTVSGGSEKKKLWIELDSEEKFTKIDLKMKAETVIINEDFDIITRNPTVSYKASLALVDNMEERKENLLVYPNPAKDTLEIFWKKAFEADYVEIVDLKGKKVHAQKIEPGTTSLEFLVRSWETGLYVVRLRCGQRYLETKVLKAAN